MSTRILKPGTMIVIDFKEKDEKQSRNVAARVVAHNDKTERINVFSQGRLMWINAAQFVQLCADKNASLKRGTSVELTPLVMPETTKIIMTPTHERALMIVRKNPNSTTIGISDLLGKSTPATVFILSQLEKMGYIMTSADKENNAIFISTKSGNDYQPGSVDDVKIPRLKNDSSGEVVVTKKERVLALLKEKRTVAEIAALTGAAPSYIRGVRERSSKTMDVPEKGTVKRAVYDSLRKGRSLAETAVECKVTVAYAYQVRQQMITAKII